MHIPSTSFENSILNGDKSFLANALLETLNPGGWPISIAQLPVGTALVGGAVRDGLLNRLNKNPDLDFVVPNNAIKITQDIAKNLDATFVVLDEQRDIARLVFKNWTIDLAKQFGSTLEEDLWHRDFRLNAIALRLGSIPEIVDPTGGIADLRKNQLVAVRERNLIEDPLRLLRALRFVAELNLSLDPQTRTFINTYSNLLPKAAPERIQLELQRIVCLHEADEVIELLKELGLLNPWSGYFDSLNCGPPTFKNQKFLNTKEICLALPLARLTHLLSDTGLTYLRFSRRQRERCKSLRKWLKLNDGLAFETLDERDRLQLHQELEDDLPALIIQLSSKQQEVWINRWRDLEDPLFHPFCPIDGHTLQEVLDLPAGPKLGVLMNHLCQERAFGRLSNLDKTFEEARNWWKHNSPFL